MKRKKSRTYSSSTKEAIASSRGEDRISKLPESVLHEIVSFLELKEVVATSLVSRKWRYLWKSVPILRFRYEFCWESSGERGNKKVYEKNKEMDFISRALLLRDDSIIRGFYLTWGKRIGWSRILTWIYFLLKRGVNELHLDINTSEPHLPELPLLLFTSSSSIQVFVLKASKLLLPVTICLAPRLRILKLANVQLPPGDSNGELVFSCPVLEDLILRDCASLHLKILNISAPQLKTLVVVNHRNSVGSCVIKICTPNLTSLGLFGSFYKDYILENLPSLDCCTIQGASYTGSLHTQSLMKIFNGLHDNVATLELQGSCCEVDRSVSLPVNKSIIGTCSKEDQSCLHQTLQCQQTLTGTRLGQDWQLNALLNIRCLKLKVESNASLLRFVAEIFEGMLLVETVVLELKAFCLVEEKDWLMELSLPEMLYNRLKRIKILNIYCCSNELMFLKVILANAANLESITVTYTEQISISKAEEMENFTMELQIFPKASRNVAIHYQEFIPSAGPGCKALWLLFMGGATILIDLEKF